MSTPAQEPPAKRQKTNDGTVNEEKETKPKVPRFLNPSDLVTLVIGKEPGIVEFKIHTEFACDGSPVFNAAFNSKFIEGQTQIYKLDDTTPRAVRLLYGWLYAGNIDLELGKTWSTTEENISEIGKLLELWVLADKLLIPQLQNLTIRALQASYALPRYVKGAASKKKRLNFLGSYTVSAPYVYENTPETSQLRRFWAEQMGACFASHNKLLPEVGSNFGLETRGEDWEDDCKTPR